MPGGRGDTRSNSPAPDSSRKLKDLTVEDLRGIVREEVMSAVQRLEERVSKVESQLGTVQELGQKVPDIEAAVQDMSDKLEDLKRDLMPKLSAHTENIAAALTLRQLDLEVHRRKWNLTVHGLPGVAGEDEETTRKACVNLAKTHLRIEEAKVSDFAACHRLSRAQNAGVILRFVDLSMRNRWLSGARNLKGHPGNVSISQDLPPVLRPLKTELLNKRKDLPIDQKTRTSVRFLPQWPYVEMVTSGGGPRVQPSITKKTIIDSALELNTRFNMDN